MVCCSARMAESTKPRRNVPRTKRMMMRSSSDRRSRPVDARSGRVSSTMFEDDVHVARRRQMRANCVENVLGQVLMIHLARLGLELDGRVRLEITLRIESTQQLRARKAGKLGETALERRRELGRRRGAGLGDQRTLVIVGD